MLKGVGRAHAIANGHMDFQTRQAGTDAFAQALRLIIDRFLYEDDDAAELFEMWQQIIDDESGYAGIVVAPQTGSMLAFGISVALKSDFVERQYADPEPFRSRRIFDAWKRGDSPIMDREEVAQANAAWGVDLFVLHHGYAPMNDEAGDYGVRMALAAEFVRQHAGLNMRSVTQEFYDRSWLDLSMRFGWSLRRDFVDHPQAAHLPPNERPFIADIRRSDVLSPGRPKFPTDALFETFHAPALRLNAQQRRMLRTALEEDGAEESHADDRWTEIYDRILSVDASFAGDVLAWIRSHPEELHPYLTPDGMQ